MKPLRILLPIIILLGIVWYLTTDESTTSTNTSVSTSTVSTTTSVNVEEFVSKNLSTLSPVKEQLGGTFYVTSITAKNGTGVVNFEDGHSSYTADFKYETNANGEISAISFKLR